MISKRIATKPENDNYARLADYIAAAGHSQNLHSDQKPGRGQVVSGVKAENEKCLISWFQGGLGGDDFNEGIVESVDVQAMNTRTTKEKTYHLMVSFRPEDEARLTPELYKNIEESFALALGFDAHQRHCGVHKNTGNLHMHIAYNMIHPEKFTRHEPFGDYHKRDRVCRQLEKDFGLVVDAGIDPDKKKRSNALQPGAATVEAHTGQQSFESYVRQFHDPIMQALAKGSWQALHSELGVHGIEIVPHGNGLIFCEMRGEHVGRGKHAVKASAVDRLLSKNALEKALGAYKPSLSHEQTTQQSKYEAVPIHRGPERGQLYQEYQAGIEHRKRVLGAIDEARKAEGQLIQEKWEKHRREITANSALSKGAKMRLMKLSRLHEQQEALTAHKTAREQQKELSQEVSYASWVNFLRMKVLEGNDIALAVLRSRGHELVEPEQQEIVRPDRAQTLKRQAQILSQEMTKKGRKRLLAMEHMQAIAPGIKCDVDKKGTLIFSLPDGGTVRDSGKKISFSPELKEIAEKYAQQKWGKQRVRLEENVLICQKKTIELQNNKNTFMER